MVLRITNSRGLSASATAAVSGREWHTSDGFFRLLADIFRLLIRPWCSMGEASTGSTGETTGGRQLALGRRYPGKRGSDAFETTHAFEGVGNTSWSSRRPTMWVSRSRSYAKSTSASGNPVASFIVSPQPPVSPGTTSAFDASASTAAAREIPLSYTWSFGNDTGSGPNPAPTTTKAYSHAGTIVVTLTVTATSGRSGIVSQAVAVR